MLPSIGFAMIGYLDPNILVWSRLLDKNVFYGRTVIFSVEASEPFPTTFVAATIAIVATSSGLSAT